MPFLSGDTVDLEPLDPDDDGHVAVYRESKASASGLDPEGEADTRLHFHCTQR